MSDINNMHMLHAEFLKSHVPTLYNKIIFLHPTIDYVFFFLVCPKLDESL
jgi:hypothetical protein